MRAITNRYQVACDDGIFTLDKFIGRFNTYEQAVDKARQIKNSRWVYVVKLNKNRDPDWNTLVTVSGKNPE